MFALTPARVLIDGELVRGRAVLVDGDRIASIVADIPAGVTRIDVGAATLVPGFIDVQVNGGGDALFNDDPSVATLRRIAAAHARFGTTGLLPTLISDDLSVIRAGIAAVEDAMTAGIPGILGIHIEGPFINVARKGIHNAEKVRGLDEEGLAVLTSLRRGRTLVTLAPEIVGHAMIARLVDAGVIVAAGHTAGTFHDIADAADHGLSGITHLFNAMSPLGSREPGAVGAALYDDRLWCSMIVDGHHVDPVTLKLALRCKPADRVLLVTDAMPPTGGASAEFMLNGHRITAREGRLTDENGTLAGADIDMAASVRAAQRLLGVPMVTACAMASANPAAFIGLDRRLGRIAAGYTASLVALDDAGSVMSVWIDGRPVDIGPSTGDQPI